MEVSPPAATPSRLRRVLRVAERVAVAHVAAYPIAFLWAVAAMPLTIHLYARVLDGFEEPKQISDFVVLRLAWPAGVAFALAHATAVPSLVTRDPKVGLRRTLLSLGALVAVGVVAGAASWLWLILR